LPLIVEFKQYDFEDQDEQSIRVFNEPLRVWRLNS